MIQIFFHIATINNFQKIFDELYHQIELSGLIQKIDKLNICTTGFNELIFKNHPKIYHKHFTDLNKFEFPTLLEIEKEIWRFEKNIKILYIHNFGSTNDTINKQNWRKYLSYFNILQNSVCIEALDNYDTCGVDYRLDPSPHYSGNFWWGNSSYIKTLPKIQDISNQNSKFILTLRHNAELYIGMNEKINPRILHQSNISQYHKHLYNYDEKLYISKINKDNIII